MTKTNKIPLQRGQKILIVFVAAFVLAAMLLGAVLGISVAIESASAVAKYEGVNVDEDTAKFLSSYHKYTYIALLRAEGIEAYDDDEFWYSSDENGKTYAKSLAEGARAFISDILISNYYYDRYASLDSTARDAISDTINAVVDRFYGDTGALKEALAECGLTYSAFTRATEMMYKASRAKSIIYGASGSTLRSEEYLGDCETYLAEYSRVKLLVIRSENTFVLDENEERVTDGGGYKMRDLTEEEKSERAELIAKIDSEIEGYRTGADVQMSEGLFESYIAAQREGDSEIDAKGYYFAVASDYTVAFAEDVSRDIVETALTMNIGEYAKVTTDFAVCYLYRCAPLTGAYLDTSETGFFADFYSDAADFLFLDLLSRLRVYAQFNDKLSDADITEVGYDSDLYPRY